SCSVHTVASLLDSHDVANRGTKVLISTPGEIKVSYSCRTRSWSAGTMKKFGSQVSAAPPVIAPTVNVPPRTGFPALVVVAELLEPLEPQAVAPNTRAAAVPVARNVRLETRG